MNIRGTLLMLISIFVLAGCGETKKAPTAIKAPSGSRERSGITPAEQESFNDYTSGQWGHIGTDAQYAEAFNRELKNLVSATLDPAALGYVSPVSGDSTFVHFRARVHLDSSRNIDLSRSFLRVLIKDEHVGKKDGDTLVEEIAIFFNQATSGSLDGNRLVVSFKDEYGEITLDGKINQYYNSQNYYVGEVLFENYKHFNNESPMAGLLGGFSIPTSGIISQ